MPIQNVGTLLENLVVAETAGLLIDRLKPGGTLGFAAAFAMPPLTPWVPHPQAVGFSTENFRQLLESGDRSLYMEAFARALRHCQDRGPNGALLVGLVAALKGSNLAIWANDIPEGHYGNALPDLANIEELIEEMISDSPLTIDVATCAKPYPGSIAHLAKWLASWREDAELLLGFLDPMRYRLQPGSGPYTHPEDHRRWLRTLGAHGNALSIHFTGNSDAPSLTTERESMRLDLKESGFPHWVEFKRQHYVVSVGAPEGAVIGELIPRVQETWRKWCLVASGVDFRPLKIEQSAR